MPMPAQPWSGQMRAKLMLATYSTDTKPVVQTSAVSEVESTESQDAIQCRSRADCFFAMVLGMNLLMSITNTILLSFMVKTLQSSQSDLLGDLSRPLELPAYLKRDKSIRVREIKQLPPEKNDPQALFVRSWPNSVQGEAEILFGNADESLHETSRMLLRANGDAQIFTRMLNLSLNTRRVLEFDAEQQSVSLPHLSSFDLSSKKMFLVGEQLDCVSELGGTLDYNLDVQSNRQAQLSCSSQAQLRLISRLGDLNLAAGERIHLKANQVRLAGQKLYLLDGLRKFDKLPTLMGHKQGNAGAAQQLLATELVLVDGLLMGAITHSTARSIG